MILWRTKSWPKLTRPIFTTSWRKVKDLPWIEARICTQSRKTVETEFEFKNSDRNDSRCLLNSTCSSAEQLIQSTTDPEFSFPSHNCADKLTYKIGNTFKKVRLGRLPCDNFNWTAADESEFHSQMWIGALKIVKFTSLTNQGFDCWDKKNNKLKKKLLVKKLKTQPATSTSGKQLREAASVLRSEGLPPPSGRYWEEAGLHMTANSEYVFHFLIIE